MISSDFQNNGVWGAIENARNQFNAFSEDAKEDPRFKELNDMLDYVLWLLETSSCVLLTASELQTITQQLNSVTNLLVNNANNWSHYAQVSNAFGAIFNVLPYPRIKKIFRSEANDAIEEFVTIVSNLKGDIAEAAEETKSKIDQEISKLKFLVAEEKENFEELMSDANSDQSILQNSLTELENNISALDTRIQSQLEAWDADNRSQIVERLSELSDSFSDAQAKRSDEFQELKNAFSSSLANLKDSIKTVQNENVENQKVAKEALQQSQEEYEAQAKEVLDNINGFYEKAGQTVLSGDFVTSAKEEKGLYQTNALFAKILMLIAVIILGVMYLSLAKKGSFEITDLLMRLPISVVILIPGFYFASLANQHRKSAIKLRSLGLRIKAFDAFLASADGEEKKQLRGNLAPVFFEDSQNANDTKDGFFSQGGKVNEGLVKFADKALDKITPS